MHPFTNCNVNLGLGGISCADPECFFKGRVSKNTEELQQFFKLVVNSLFVAASVVWQLVMYLSFLVWLY